MDYATVLAFKCLTMALLSAIGASTLAYTWLRAEYKNRRIAIEYPGDPWRFPVKFYKRSFLLTYGMTVATLVTYHLIF